MKVVHPGALAAVMQSNRGRVRISAWKASFRGEGPAFSTPVLSFVGSPQFTSLSVTTMIGVPPVDWDNIVVSRAPEPSAALILLVGLLAALAARKRPSGCGGQLRLLLGGPSPPMD